MTGIGARDTRPAVFFSLLRATSLASPLLLRLAPPGTLPPGLAYAVGGGRWLALVGIAASFAVLLRPTRLTGLSERVVSSWSARLEQVPSGASSVAAGLAAAALMAVAMPSYRWSGVGLSGDEPKYLALAESLYRDLDVDVSMTGDGPLTWPAFFGNARALAGAIKSACASLDGGDAVRDGQVWNQGNWTLAGLHGGRYLVQSPGLPAVLAPGVLVQRLVMPDLGGPVVPEMILVVLWAIATVGIVRLASDVSGSRLAGLGAGVMVALSAPFLVGGYHFYPETVAVAAVPWLFRSIRGAAAARSALGVTVVALTAGALPWLHPKFLFLAIGLVVLLAAKVGRTPKLVIVVAASLLPLAALLLFDHHLTGLLRPDALYRRYGDAVYAGPSAFLSPDMLSGLSTALFGARDGLLIIAPVLAAGILALPLLWRRERRTAIELGLVFASLWVAAAVHGGGAAGPPGRLMAPVGTLLAAPLAVGLVELPTRAFRWTAAALLLVSLAVTMTMLTDWRRTVNPFRHMFAAGEDFSRDLPDAPVDRPDVPASARRQRDVIAGALIAGSLGFWAFALSRRGGSADSPWPELRNLHLAWWGSIVVLSAGLHALRP
jgi:hypothetical protein